MRIERILISILVLATLATPAWATTTTVYTDPSAFNTATASVFFQSVTFTGANLLSNGYADPSGVNIQDFIGNNGNLSVSGGNLVDSNSWGFAAVLPSVVYDFWFTATGPANSAINIAFTAPDGNYSSTFNFSTAGTFFFGATSSAPITGLTFSNGSTHTNTLTNFDFAEPAETPEAATLLLIGSGLMAMRFFKKRDKARGTLPAKQSEPAPVGYAGPQVAAGSAA